LRNIRNHLDTAPTTNIAVVTHQLGRGIHSVRCGAGHATSDARRLCVPEALVTG
jgi:intracellular sulfur oxidation DsrE/DsrF family protein